MSEEDNDDLLSFIGKYCKVVKDGLYSRWDRVTPEIYNKHIHEAIGGLLSRQATISIEMARAPTTWNPHVAPLFLRSQIDAFITLAWILGDPEDRSTKYIHYGLGQERLFIEHMEQTISETEEDEYDGSSEHMREIVRMRKSWLNAQIAEWATEVNVGSWAGISTRDMAIEIGNESIYKHAYAPFSGPVHNMWQHVGIYNVKQCTNPLHKNHLTPVINSYPPHPDFMYASAKYVSQTYNYIDEKMKISSDVTLPVDFFADEFNSINETGEDD